MPRLNQLLYLIVCAASALQSAAAEENVAPLPRGHAHNDYRHKRPLLDALDHGFCSVEADIFLIDGKLLVGHDLFDLRPSRTLEKLYLDPLRKRALANGGRIHRNGPSVMLLIDIKRDGAKAYARLSEVLAEYKEILSSVEDGKFHSRAVQVVISGDRPREAIAADSIRYAAIDGRLGDLDSPAPAHLVPLISDRWSSHFRWRGAGPFPPDEKRKLVSIVNRAHASGRRVRFWATPENPLLWRELLAADVDHINTDQLSKLRDHLLNQPPRPPRSKSQQ
ncbi:MAG: phosphatidylinositol-specific phospholipase C/glycerophosphodiester phosphodiesterase family protein [Pirellulaceae bacterium]|jgi:glycerophosphoryl diester phosphodiesterase|nr:phosphatidylinositol-specific phospholipase C/glycerophosphodiester phosphodiesterase family protein [Pirellulaceae bacterium]MDP7017168.1 phosphatidylinositol-specific phospholipase C/glycerophosphodiester phosphodiesterase family protein [Pirellulaceae bacterium]